MVAVIGLVMSTAVTEVRHSGIALAVLRPIWKLHPIDQSDHFYEWDCPIIQSDNCQVGRHRLTTAVSLGS